MSTKAKKKIVKIFQVSAVKERGYTVSLSMASFLLKTSSHANRPSQSECT